jgi:hypothetical protein
MTADFNGSAINSAIPTTCKDDDDGIARSSTDPISLNANRLGIAPFFLFAPLYLEAF